MSIDHLQLAPVMHQRASELLELFPNVVYLSGRRTIAAQAHAMACNVITDRGYIFKTYRHAATLQSAVDAHPEAQSVASIEHVLYVTLLGMSEMELSQVSDHLSGHAVDLRALEQPVILEDKLSAQSVPTEEGRAVIAWIRARPNTKYFTIRESGLVRWHWSVRPSGTTEV